ncbi:MAG: HAMP domain-containing histidine kinase [Motiliproteus sp.]|nr:HAMP domain-containing histidine kinase [Motiliproteus sp.]MCW9051543.1 HAMP domain-containing histidine kinase [Motiliproteus sp.]
MNKETSLSFSTLLASSVHDMKNSIGMLLHLLEQQRSELSVNNENYGQVHFELSRLNNYLIQMMTLYKLEEDQFQSHDQEHYLPEFVEDLVLMNRPILEARGVSIEQHVDEELCWEFDSSLVSGVLSSIFTNVIRYSDGQVRISAETVKISAQQVAVDQDQECGEHQYLCFTVEDDGEGFPEWMLGRIDKMQLGVDFVSGSTGFGLYFAQQVAKLHRQNSLLGYVELSNGGSLGGGCFKLYLP